MDIALIKKFGSIFGTNKDRLGEKEEAELTELLNDQTELQKAKYRFAIVTVLEHEADAVHKVFAPFADQPSKIPSLYYSISQICEPRDDHDPYYILITKTRQMGTSAAAVTATAIFLEYPEIKTVLMVGIAGGIPDPDRDPTKNVYLGDVVVNNDRGVIQYDYGKFLEDGNFEVTSTSDRPDVELLALADKLVQETSDDPDYAPWLAWINDVQTRKKTGEKWQRPDPETDEWAMLGDEVSSSTAIRRGRIACANAVLKDVKKREKVRKEHGALAVEMEGAGIADAAWSFGRKYFIIRGICDYCDKKKNKIWQNYAALAAAAYARALLDQTTPSAK